MNSYFDNYCSFYQSLFTLKHHYHGCWLMDGINFSKYFLDDVAADKTRQAEDDMSGVECDQAEEQEQSPPVQCCALGSGRPSPSVDEPGWDRILPQINTHTLGCSADDKCHLHFLLMRNMMDLDTRLRNQGLNNI